MIETATIASIFFTEIYCSFLVLILIPFQDIHQRMNPFHRGIKGEYDVKISEVIILQSVIDATIISKSYSLGDYRLFVGILSIT